MNKIAITTGDPNGIGAEITIKALNRLDLPIEDVLLISNKKVLDFYGKLDKNYEILEIPFEGTIEPGKVTAECGEFSFLSVQKACEIGARAIVTAPVAKNALYLSGHKFSGQTEILQKYLAHDNQLAEMLFVAGNFRVLLLTRHCALKDVNLTVETIVEKITNLESFFHAKPKIKKPRFALCGFNPHAGEDGILGREEQEILQPAVEMLRSKGISITDPLPADTLFVKAGREYWQYKLLQNNKEIENPTSACGNFSHAGEKTQGSYDCFIANYHDQGLIPIKTVAGDSTVNMTIGLDIIRTSPGHGTAFDIAGKNIAREDSMIAAIREVL